MTTIDDEWTRFIQSSGEFVPPHKQFVAATVAAVASATATDVPVVQVIPISINDDDEEIETIANAKDAKPFELYISTKTKVLFLNQVVDIQNIFWQIPITEYGCARPGIMKKQIKIVSKTVEEYEQYKLRLVGIPYYTETIIKQIDNPSARSIKFKDERKITVGISKKDIMNCRIRTKNAFYNCFAMIMRFLYDGEYREIHVKVFNTGKLEIPGILNNRLLEIVKIMILEVLTPHLPIPIEFVENKTSDGVLINSNFHCGYYIQREKLHHILRTKYGIDTAYDPCSYPGVKSKFYFNNSVGLKQAEQSGCITNADPKMTMSELVANKKYTEVSVMVFRTGSCLIVGNCSEPILLFIFKFIRRILMTEREHIYMTVDEEPEKVKKRKIRKRTMLMTPQYYSEHVIANA